MVYIKWCPKCNGRILTTYQQENNLLCEDCQKEHARSLKNRIGEEIKKEDTNA